MSARVKAGDVLGGKYRVERVLGAGGMGMVVAARHVELGQRVALKFMLKEAMAEPAHAERFAREARAAVRLQSPHTARVLDVGKLKNGEPYMVMEYLDGQDLDEVLQRTGPMPPHVAVDYLLQACEAFAEAHSLAMIHRDIKLKNLFLTKTMDGRPFVKVLDFGLAKTIGQMGDVSLTATSAVFGSPQYMSPEQMKSAKDVDTRSDIWSLGVCLYELLTGRVPFDASGLAEICAMVLKDPVVPPSRWVQGLPHDLEAVIVKCLAKDPAQRFQTVAELAFALEPWAATEGSARRVLHVMQTVQKTEIPTLVTAPAVSHPEEMSKTIDAWDTGGPTRPHRRSMAIPFAIGAGSLLVLGLVLGGAAIVARGHNKNKAAAAASVVDPPTAPLSAEPSPPPEPPPSPTILGASPNPTPAPTQTAAIAVAPSPPPTTLAAATARPPAPKPAPPVVAAPPVKPAPPPPAKTAATTPAPKSSASAKKSPKDDR
ncbi:MAG: serine/threonine protein kinase [Labilithrix sp.]|nr:serine/threonine protein kinase [Labilithrix sp.]